MKEKFCAFLTMAGFTVLTLTFYNSLINFDSVIKNAEPDESSDSGVINEAAIKMPESKQVFQEPEKDREIKVPELENATNPMPVVSYNETKSEPVLLMPVVSSEVTAKGIKVKVTESTQPRSEKTKVATNMSSGETEAKFMERMKLRMDERKARVREYCKNKGIHHNWKLIRDGLITSSEYKTVMCQIPKTGITNWKKLFADLKEIDFTGQGFVTKYFHRYQISGEEKYRRLTDPDWIKMTVVREPLERLVSAYRSKIEPPTDAGLIRLANQIESVYADKSSPNYEEPKYPTFSTYVNFLVTQNPRIPYRSDQHWATFSKLCQFCDFEYDIIGHQETVMEDSEYLLRLVGAPKRFSLGRGRTNKTDHDIAYDYYSTVKPRENVMKLYKLYEEDYSMFGYPRPTWFDRIFDDKQDDSAAF